VEDEDDTTMMLNDTIMSAVESQSSNMGSMAIQDSLEDFGSNSRGWYG